MQGEELRKGNWIEEEDERLICFVKLFGDRRWDALAKASGLKRSGKSCRLRWLNYLRPYLKHGDISVEEENIILKLHQQWGNKWSKIAKRLPGRTDNEIKNYWRTHLSKKFAQLEVQEGDSQYESKNAEEDLFLFKNKGATNSATQTHHTLENQGSMKDMGTDNILSNSSDGAFGLSDFGLTSSPYETHLSHWISELSNDHQRESYYHNECNSIESISSCSYELELSPDDSNTWDCSGFLWDMS
ncbi:hypothetical protein UlMin_044127 [Ulmus minor]